MFNRRRRLVETPSVLLMTDQVHFLLRGRVNISAVTSLCCGPESWWWFQSLFGGSESGWCSRVSVVFQSLGGGPESLCWFKQRHGGMDPLELRSWSCVCDGGCQPLSHLLFVCIVLYCLYCPLMFGALGSGLR